MIKLQFKIDKYHLAHNLCLKYFRDKKQTKWQKLKKELHTKYGDYSGFLFFEPQYIGYNLNLIDFKNRQGVGLVKDKGIVLDIFNDIFTSAQFKKAFTETAQYKKKVEREWSKNGKKALNLLKNISRLEMKNNNADIFILHPLLDSGSYMGNNVIEWGTTDHFKNYQTIGLAHELLHLFTEKQADWLMHGIIYLAVDEELRIRLNGSKKYFREGTVKTYHKKLIGISRKLLPYWEEYLKAESKENIIDFWKRIHKNLNESFKSDLNRAIF